MSTLTHDAPQVVRLGSNKPWFPPREFALLTEHFQPDGEWITLLRGVHYRIGSGLFRQHLRRWAQQNRWEVEMVKIPDMLALRQMSDAGVFQQQLADAGVELKDDESPGLTVRFLQATPGGRRVAA